MKRTIFIAASIFAIMILSSTSCEEEPFINIQELETRIYNEIKAHREANGIGGTFVHQFLMVKEAQLYSAKMAFGTQDVSTSGIQEHWDILNQLGGENNQTLIQKVPSSYTAPEIVQVWKDNPETDSLLLLNYTQCGAGIATSDGFTYVTVLMMLIPE